MPSKTALVFAATLALASSAVAEADRPRIFYPQRAKRDVDAQVDAADDDNEEMKRDLFHDIMDNIDRMNQNVDNNNNNNNANSNGGQLPDLGNWGDFSDIFDPINRQKSQDTPVTTVIVDKTVVVPPAGATGAPAPNPNPEPQPTTSSTRRVRPRPSTTRSGILVGPSGVILPPSSSFVSSESSTPAPPEPESSVTPQETVDQTSEQKFPTTTHGGILDPISSIVGGLFPEPSSSPSNATTEPETSSLSSSPATASPVTSDATAPVTTTVPETSTESANATLPETSIQTTDTPTETPTGLLPILTSVVSSILPIPTTESANVTTTDGVQTSSSPIPIISTTETSTIPTETSGSPTDTTSFPTLTVTDVPGGNVTTTGGETSIQTPTLTPTDTANVTETTTSATLTSSVLPTSSGAGVITSSPVNNATVPATSTSFETSSTPIETSSSVETTTVATTPTETSPVPTSTPTGVTSITPTGTGSSNWLPTTMIVEPTSLSFTAPTTTETATTATALPTNIPKVIIPSDGDKPPPKGSVPIQIGFKFPLNYDFVSGNSVAAAQIFQTLPIALAGASGIDVQKVQISKLVPMDTRATAGYITTLAKLHYPETLIDSLKASIWAPNSKLYNNPSEMVNNLTALINPTIDILGNDDDEGIKSTDSNNSNDAFGSSSDSSSQTGKQRATTAGIVMGAVGLGAMYGAAMFIVARRYKRKRQNHRRSSSISSVGRSEEMQYAGNGSPALMGGALLSPNNRGTYGGQSQNSMQSSARTANISNPVATENSLGWN